MYFPTFKAERDIADRIQKSQSVAYLVPVTLAEEGLGHEVIEAHIKSRDFKNFRLEEAEAALTDFDLYPVKSILVTTIWNGNDDIFTKEETWAARHTPTHKPDNIDHDELVIVGHMINCWPMTEDGDIIPEETELDDLPDVYHLVNSSVIYKHWKDEERLKQVEELVTAIKKGEKFVSMECLFKNFNYGIQSSDGSMRLVQRNEKTSFLSKHLAAYGGKGEYNGEKVGRVLTNIVFKGKGYVDNPANPGSIIFAKKHVFTSTASAVSQDGGVLSQRPQNKDTNTMADDNKTLETIQSQLAKLLEKSDEQATAIKKLEGEKVALETKLADAAAAHTKAVEGLQGQIETLKTEKTALDEAVKAAQQVVTDTKAQLEAANKAKDEAEGKVAEAAKVAAKAARVTKLTAAKVNPAKVNELADKFAALDDAAFEAVVATLAEAGPKVEPPSDEDEGDDEEEDDDFDGAEEDSAGSEVPGNVAASAPNEARAALRKDLRGLVKAHAKNRRNNRKGDK